MGLTHSQIRRRRERQTADDTRLGTPSMNTDLEKLGQTTMPSHWTFEFAWAPNFLKPILRFGLEILSLASLGHSQLEEIWEVCCADERTWLESTGRLSDRLNTIVVVAGLLLSSTAAFITTVPPLTREFNYTLKAVYVCLLLSFATSLGTLIVGSAIMFVVSKCSAEWFVRTHMGSQSRILCTMYLIAYPFISMGVSGSMLAIALLVTAWTSENELVAKGAVWLLLFPLTCLPVWIWTQVKIGPDGGSVQSEELPTTAEQPDARTAELGQLRQSQSNHADSQVILPVTRYRHPFLPFRYWKIRGPRNLPSWVYTLPCMVLRQPWLSG